MSQSEVDVCSFVPSQVADFGLSKIKRNTLVSGGVRGTLPWMAPELLNGSSSKVSEKVSLFSVKLPNFRPFPLTRACSYTRGHTLLSNKWVADWV